jgi:NAD(P) transhydrogenase subunit alpha
MRCNPLSFARRAHPERSIVKIFVPKETTPGELRVAMIPSVVRKFAQNEFVVEVETGAGSSAFFADAEYVEAGASIASDFATLI